MRHGKAGLLGQRIGDIIQAESRWPWPDGLRPGERLRFAALAGCVFICLFYGLLQLAAVFDNGGSISLFFPIAGLCLLFGFLFGPVYLPVPIVAVLAGDAILAWRFDPLTALHIARQAILYGAAGMLLRLHYGRNPATARSSRLGALLATALGAVIVNLAAALPIFAWAGALARSDVATVAVGFFMGDASGLLLVVPPALLLADRLLERRQRVLEPLVLGRRDQLIAAGLLALTTGLVLLALSGFAHEMDVAAAMTPALLPILIGAMLFGYTIAVGLFSVAAALLLGTSIVVADAPGVLALQTVLVICCIATLAVGAATDDRKGVIARLDASVAERTRRLDVKNAALIRRNAELRAVAITDHLTGLGNRRAFEHELSRRLARASPGTGLLLLDIDRFKRINDAHGHTVGDQALVHIARVLAAGLRGNDLLARIGGEEFAVLCSAADVDQLHEVAERLRRLVIAAPLVLGANDERLAISISVGGTILGSADDVDSLLRTADRALYAAKRAGRNRSRIVSPPDRLPAAASA